MPKDSAAGAAALAICEALLLTLADLKIVSAKALADALEDAAPPDNDKPDAVSVKVAAIIGSIRASTTALNPTDGLSNQRRNGKHRAPRPLNPRG